MKGIRKSDSLPYGTLVLRREAVIVIDCPICRKRYETTVRIERFVPASLRRAARKGGWTDSLLAAERDYLDEQCKQGMSTLQKTGQPCWECRAALAGGKEE